MAFRLTSWALAGVFLALVWIFARGCRKFPTLWTALPRHKILGEILGVLCLLWAGKHACDMLEGGLARFHILVWILVPVVAILAYSHLDYLFARALGGLFVLMSILLMYQAFVARLPARSVYSVACYVIGLLGLYALGAPWRFRDLLKKAKESDNWSRTAAVLASTLAAILLVWPLF